MSAQKLFYSLHNLSSLTPVYVDEGQIGCSRLFCHFYGSHDGAVSMDFSVDEERFVNDELAPLGQRHTFSSRRPVAAEID